MSGVTGDIKDLFNYKYKKRDDQLSDQYNRLFMTKVMLIAAFLTGMEWYSDEINCMVPGLAGGAVGGFSGKACWINGFYVYDELRNAIGCNGYFGMPTNTIHNGTLAHASVPCETCVVQDENMDCKPMSKRFYIQYQWYPFFLAALALLYYVPYFLFHIANEDLKNLKDEIKKFEPDIPLIVKVFFNPNDQAAVKRQKQSIILNVVIKLGYIISNIIVFCLCDSSLNGDFIGFGLRWLRWSNIPGHDNYVDARPFVDPGDQLLPTFGFCDVLEEGLDIKHTLINEHKFVCEISQHILYQYILMALWFFMVIGITVSLIGLVTMLVKYAMWEIKLKSRDGKAKVVYKRITIRQGEYLMFVRNKNELFYGAILDDLYERFSVDPNKIGNKEGFDEDAV